MPSSSDPAELSASSLPGSWIDRLFDPQGSLARRLSSSQAVTAHALNGAYGQEYATGSPSDPFGFNAQSGYYLDRQTGKYLCGARYYDWSTGRWLNRDPIGQEGGVNVYGYCQQNPLQWLDLDGLQILHVRAHMGRLNMDEKGCGHAWVVIDWPDGRHAIELQPHAHLFGGGRSNDVDVDMHNTLARPFDFEYSIPFDTKRFPNVASVIAPMRGKDYNLLTNNCADFALRILRRMTGEDYEHAGPMCPGDLSYALRTKGRLRGRGKVTKE